MRGGKEGRGEQIEQKKVHSGQVHCAHGQHQVGKGDGGRCWPADCWLAR